MILGTAAAMLLALAAPGHAGPADSALAKARAALDRGDGIAAEIELKRAMAAGAARETVAAQMGKAMLDQGNRAKARDWLAPGRFSSADAHFGFRMLGLLERLDGNFAAAGKAYDRAIELDSRDPLLWVDIGRLRYLGGEHLLALEAADYALTLDAEEVRALEFRGQLVRDQYGLAAALPWFEAALAERPDDLSVLGEYAATLGDLGRASEMLVATRKILAIDGHNARAFQLQAILAARGGEFHTARSQLNKTRGLLASEPATLLLDGIIELKSGNYLLAIEALEKLVSLQPANGRAQELLASAYYGAGNYRLVAARFAALATRSDASAYLLTTVARAHEVLGQRDLAAPLLDRAARAGDRDFAPVPENKPVGAMIAAGNAAGAAAGAEQMRQRFPNSAIAHALAGDAQFAIGDRAAATERYRLAARVGMSDSLLHRFSAALANSGQGIEAVRLVENHFAANPSSRTAARIAAFYASRLDDWGRAAQLLEHLRSNGGEQDSRLLADLALAQLKAGDSAAAEATAREAYRIQPANALAAQVWGMSLMAQGERKADAAALLAKAKAT